MLIHIVFGKIKRTTKSQLRDSCWKLCERILLLPLNIIVGLLNIGQYNNNLFEVKNLVLGNRLIYKLTENNI